MDATCFWLTIHHPAGSFQSLERREFMPNGVMVAQQVLDLLV